MRPAPSRSWAAWWPVPVRPSWFSFGARARRRRRSRSGSTPCPRRGRPRMMFTARGVLRHDDLRHLLVDAARIVRVRRAAHHDVEVGGVAVGGEPLVAVDDPLVTVEDGTGLDRAGVGTGVVGLGHREARLHAAFRQREQPLLVLLRRAVLDQDFLVAGVRRDDPEQRRGARAVGQHLVHVGVLQEGQVHAPRTPAAGAAPHSLRCLTVFWIWWRSSRASATASFDVREPSDVQPVQLVLDRQDVLVDDLRRGEPDLVHLVVEMRYGLDVHGHRSVLPLLSLAPAGGGANT